MKQVVPAGSEKQGNQPHTDREENRLIGETHGFVDNCAEASAPVDARYQHLFL